MADQTDVPEEIKDYYQTERRERTGIAWLLAFGTLIITVVLGAGIFFAGRWAYRQVAGTDEETATPTEIAQNEEQEQQTAQDTEDGNDQPDNQDNQDGQSGGAVQGNEDQNHSEEANETSDTSEESQEDDTDSAPVTGSAADEDLPGTGPSGTIAVFVAVSLLGYFVHRLKLWRILGV